MLKRNPVFVLVAVVCGLGLFGGGTVLAGTPSIYPGQLISGTLPSGVQMVSADLNGDGLSDLVVADDANSSTSPPAGGVWVFLAQKAGGYVAPVYYATECLPRTLAVADLGNGHPDIVVGNQCSTSGNQVSVLLGNGDGTFKAAVNYSPDTASSFKADSITVGDATGDGKPDVVLGTSAGTVYVIPGNGDGTLDISHMQKLTLSINSISNGVIVTDINHDGLPDIVAASGCSSAGAQDDVDVFLGGSTGTFSSTPSQTVAVGACPEFGVDNDNLIGSTDPDVAVANYNDGTLQVLSNSAGTLTADTPIVLPAGACPLWVHVADVDGDGNPDLVTADNCSDTVDIVWGQSGGDFATSVQLVPAGATGYDVAAFSNTDSGPLNLVALDYPNNNATHLMAVRNLGNRQFLSYAGYAYQNGSKHGQHAYDMASADFNGDGKPDIVTANYGDATLSVLLNNGKGGFDTPEVISTGATVATYAVAVGDVNSDGKQDVVTADSSGNLYVYLGNGDGTFAAPIKSAIASSNVLGIALGDVDGDHHLDAMVSERGSNQVQVCKGDGQGDFNCNAYAPISVNSPNRVALVDLNGDKKLDLVVTSNTGDGTVSGATDAYVYLGNGNGTFASTPTATLPVAGGGWGIAVGDLNDDGKPDLVFGSQGNSVSLFTGKGDGTFNAAATYASGTTAVSHPDFVVLVDVNSDSQLDIVAANENESTLSVLTNTGNGTFNAPVTYAAGDGVFPVLVLDVDGDGLPDIVTANFGSGTLDNSTVSVYPHNHAPVVKGASLSVTENQSASGSVAATDAEQDPLTFAATQPGHGSVNLNAATGSFTYTPTTGYSGSDSFTVTASNGLETSAPATVSITVNAAPPPPASGGGGSSGGGGGGFGLLSLGALLLPLLRRQRH